MLVLDYSKEPISDLLRFLSAPQVKDLCSISRLRKTPKKKDAMIDALINSASKQMTLTPMKTSDDILRDRIKQKLGTCVKLSSEFRDILDKIHMLYTITNPDLKIPNDIYWLLNDIHFKNVIYPQVEIDKVQIFTDCEECNK